jgi:hypothetical protein
MSVELEARVRRANLISRDRHLERLYDDLSRRLLRDIYSKKEGRMTETTDRPEPKTVEEVPREKEAFRPAPAPRQRRNPAFVPAIVTAVIAIGVIVAVVVRQPALVADTPVEIAEQFMAALNDHDAAAVRSLLADEDAMIAEAAPGVPGIEIEQQIEQEEVLGWTYDVETCVDRTLEGESTQSVVTCTYSITDDITRAIGNEPYEGSRYEFVVVDGKIVSAENTEEDEQYHDESFRVFGGWLDANHPNPNGIAYEYFDEENLAKLEQYVPEFLAAMEETG